MSPFPCDRAVLCARGKDRSCRLSLHRCLGRHNLQQASTALSISHFPCPYFFFLRGRASARFSPCLSCLGLQSPLTLWAGGCQFSEILGCCLLKYCSGPPPTWCCSPAWGWAGKPSPCPCVARAPDSSSVFFIHLSALASLWRFI